MAYLRQYELTEDIGDILRALQINIYGEEKYYCDGICDTWDGIEDIAARYDLRDKADLPFFVSLSPYDLPRDKRVELLFDEVFSPYIECIRERTLPPAEPGHMYADEGYNARSFSEITWHERVASQSEHCRCCIGTEYEGEPFFPLVVFEDDGTTSFHWRWCGSIWTEMGDDYYEIVSWNDDGTPRGTKGNCSHFDWS